MLMDRTNFPQASWLLQFRVKNLSLGSGAVDQRVRSHPAKTFVGFR